MRAFACLIVLLVVVVGVEAWSPAAWRRRVGGQFGYSQLTTSTSSSLFQPPTAAQPLVVRMIDDGIIDDGPFEPFDDADVTLEKVGPYPATC